MEAASDAAIWDFALQAAAVIITKDEDFAQRKALIDSGSAVIWIRLPNTRSRELLSWFETTLPDILSALERGETLIEVV
jgi:predicted nuclease of predicted toxin-antitoxin system